MTSQIGADHATVIREALADISYLGSAMELLAATGEARGGNPALLKGAAAIGRCISNLSREASRAAEAWDGKAATPGGEEADAEEGGDSGPLAAFAMEKRRVIRGQVKVGGRSYGCDPLCSYVGARVLVLIPRAGPLDRLPVLTETGERFIGVAEEERDYFSALDAMTARPGARASDFPDIMDDAARLYVRRELRMRRALASLDEREQTSIQR